MPLPLLGVIAIFAGTLGLVMLAVVILLSIFWLWMLVDALTSSLPPVEKLIWVLVIFFLHFLGALLYFFIARNGARGNVVP